MNHTGALHRGPPLKNDFIKDIYSAVSSLALSLPSIDCIDTCAPLQLMPSLYFNTSLKHVRIEKKEIQYEPFERSSCPHWSFGKKLIAVAALLVTRTRAEYFNEVPVNSNNFCK